MHALIIEDEAIIGMSIEEALRDIGFTSFDFAANQDDAVAAAAAGRCPDLITADVRLAPGCGIDAIRQICSHRRSPVIYITGSVPQVEARCPGEVIVAKPFTPADIARAARQVLVKPA